MRYATEQRNVAESVAELREIANGRNDILAEAAGIGRVMVCVTSKPRRHELVGAGMLISAGGVNGTPLDYDELEHWTEWGTSVR